MNRLLRVLGVFSLFVFLSSSARADFLDDFTGNSGIDSNPNITGWVSFAVYENPAGANWLTDLGLTAGAGSTFDGTEENVFFYEIVIDDSSALPLTSLAIPEGDHPWNGIGYGSGSVFNESGPSPVVGGANQTIGPEAAPGTTDTSGTLDGTAPFVADTGTPPVLFFIDGTGNGFFIVPFAGPGNSFILILTSDANPNVVTFASGTAGSGVLGPGVQVPVSNPEPGTLALLSVGMMGGAGVFGWRRRKKKEGEKNQEPSPPQSE